MSDFKSKVFDVVKKIPEGKVLTYREVAEHAEIRRHIGRWGIFLRRIMILKSHAIE